MGVTNGITGTCNNLDCHFDENCLSNNKLSELCLKYPWAQKFLTVHQEI